MSEPVQRPSLMPITFAFDVLYTLVIFYEYTQWRMVSGIGNHLLMLLVLSITVIDWLSVRATYDMYSLQMMLIDLTDVFLLINVVPTLFPTSSPLGYHASYWLYLAATSGLYSVWDFILARRAPVGQRNRQRLRRWGVIMLVSFIVCSMTYVGLFWMTSVHSGASWYAYGTWIVAAPGYLLWSGSLLVWLLQRLEPIAPTLNGEEPNE